MFFQKCNNCQKRLTCSTCDNDDDGLFDQDSGNHKHIRFHVRLIVPSSATPRDSTCCHDNTSRLKLKLRSAHYESGNNINNNFSDGNGAKLVELSCSLSSYITYIVEKIYVGGINENINNNRCSSYHYDRRADVICLKTLIHAYAPDLEDAYLVYDIVDKGVNSLARIRHGFRNAEEDISKSFNTTFHFALCGKDFAEDVPITHEKNTFNKNSVKHGESIDLILGVNTYKDSVVGTLRECKTQAENDTISFVEKVPNAKRQQRTSFSRSSSAKRKTAGESTILPSYDSLYPSKYDESFFNTSLMNSF